MTTSENRAGRAHVDPTLLVASEAILFEHYTAAKRAADREKIYAVYIVGTHRGDADPAAQLIEDAIRDDTIAKATFHSQQVDRFAEALDKLRRLKP